jgi:hypothetical protein
MIKGGFICPQKKVIRRAFKSGPASTAFSCRALVYFMIRRIRGSENGGDLWTFFSAMALQGRERL